MLQPRPRARPGHWQRSGGAPLQAEAAGSLTSIMVQMSANSGGEVPAELVPIVR